MNAKLSTPETSSNLSQNDYDKEIKKAKSERDELVNGFADEFLYYKHKYKKKRRE